MRYSEEHVLKTRRKLLLQAGRQAKARGFDASGVDRLAASAGLTTGSLYKHFRNKRALFSALLEAEFARSAHRFERVEQQGGDVLAAWLDQYLDLRHVNAPETGCLLPSLSAEVARGDAAARETFQAGLCASHARMRRHVASDRMAWALLAQNVGAVMLARAVRDPQLQRELLESARAEALRTRAAA